MLGYVSRFLWEALLLTCQSAAKSKALGVSPLLCTIDVEAHDSKDIR
jgi:hypothetical protein